MNIFFWFSESKTHVHLPLTSPPILQYSLAMLPMARALFLQVVQLKTSPDETEGWVGMNYEQWINDLRVGGVTRTSEETASNVHREQF